MRIGSCGFPGQNTGFGSTCSTLWSGQMFEIFLMPGDSLRDSGTCSKAGRAAGDVAASHNGSDGKRYGDNGALEAPGLGWLGVILPAAKVAPGQPPYYNSAGESLQRHRPPLFRPTPLRPTNVEGPGWKRHPCLRQTRGVGRPFVLVAHCLTLSPSPLFTRQNAATFSPCDVSPSSSRVVFSAMPPHA